MRRGLTLAIYIAALFTLQQFLYAEQSTIGSAEETAVLLDTRVQYLPIDFRQVSGTRPFVHAEMNGKPFDLMVHANLALYVMTTHANASAIGIGIGGLKKASSIGIDKGGHVSDLGLAHATLKTLKVGSSEVSNVPLEVFEVPIPGLDGMLGIQWIRKNRVILNYDTYKIGFPSDDEASRIEDERLSRSGFTGHKMTWDPSTTTYAIDVEIDGKPAHLVVSTVTADTLDLHTAQVAGLPIGPKVGLEDGPRGAIVDDFLLKRQAVLTIDHQQMAAFQPRVHDLEAYSSLPSSNTPNGVITGWLGCDFMLANQAIIDFGTGILFVKRHP